MYLEQKINVLQLLLSFSYSLDLVSPELSNHQLRTALIAWELCEELSLSLPDTEDVVFAALIHDIGAITPEEKVMLHENYPGVDTLRHCILGERLLLQIPDFKIMANIIRYHHTGNEYLNGNLDSKLKLAINLLAISDSIERMIAREKYILQQSEDILEGIKSLTPKLFSLEVSEAFESLAHRESFWLDIATGDVIYRFQNYSPFNSKYFDGSKFLMLSELMKNIIDFRSHFTATHSAAISTASVKIAEKFGFSDEELEFFRIAGNLHDIGKLSVPNSILEKNGRLTPEEFAVVRQHTYYTYLITKRSGFPREIVEWASFHHEKLNGNGYPFHLKDNKISLGSRIVAVADIFTALTEDRPYRLGMDTNEVLSIIKGMVDNGSLDLFVYEVLAGNMEEILFHTGKSKAEADIQYKSFMKAVQ